LCRYATGLDFESGGDIHGWINAAVTGMSWSGKAQHLTFLCLPIGFVSLRDDLILMRASARTRPTFLSRKVGKSIRSTTPPSGFPAFLAACGAKRTRQLRRLKHLFA
jgi:hypothetical protein